MGSGEMGENTGRVGNREEGGGGEGRMLAFSQLIHQQ